MNESQESENVRQDAAFAHEHGAAHSSDHDYNIFNPSGVVLRWRGRTLRQGSSDFMIDILSLAVWGALLATPRTMHEWDSVEYTLEFIVDPEFIHPSFSLLAMNKVW